MNVDDFLPDYDVESCHEIRIAASAAAVYEAARVLDMSGSKLVRLLFRLRGMPVSALNAQGLARIRFKALVESPPEGFILGIVGRFWTPSGRLVDFHPPDFRHLHEPGAAKAIWVFEVVAEPGAMTTLRTVTRVACADGHARRSFLRYWRIIGPFSGLIRRAALRLIKAKAESGGSTTTAGVG